MFKIYINLLENLSVGKFSVGKFVVGKTFPENSVSKKSQDTKITAKQKYEQFTVTFSHLKKMQTTN